MYSFWGTCFNPPKILSFTSHQTSRLFLSTSQKWSPVVGLEIHAQISSKSKLFSSAGTLFAAPPNMQVSYVDVALPGTLPVLNKRCVEAGVLTALALNCNINKESSFDRKHYFYPDLPAGFQITQQHAPIADSGLLEFVVYNPAVGRRPQLCKARMKQLQLEQDSGKSLHDDENQRSLIDLNRAGIGLMELVFEPDLTDGEEAVGLVKELSLIFERLGVCSCMMEEGALRVDANISVHKKGQPLGVRTEVKNLNSIRSVQKAIDYEIERQIKVLEDGGKIINETRSFDVQKKQTVVMREKESALDYRFMPEPNLPPLRLTDSAETVPGTEMQKNDSIIDINAMRQTIPLLPKDDRNMLTEKYGLTLEHALLIVNQEGLFGFFNKVVENGKRNPKLASNWLLSSVLSELNDRDLTYSNCPVNEDKIGDLIDIIQNQLATSITAKKILNMIFSDDQRFPTQILKDCNWQKISDENAVEEYCLSVMKERSKEVKKYGQKKLLNLLVKDLANLSNDRIETKTAITTFERLLKL